ncbi:hypothetical protein BU26DRAFT_263868 [Trematosphaeria pertusa]|uniref:Uncharacterized protein n=1 Tax=Trematosphaeria pertusa TaxID=390896 RepID=A0A6A6IIR2_9PLEO|nr:uncharacterized protein BU26DRAFT_263868 [Trematosphaeria pertusa]KAF2250464.1 hypothetical protein BU26DRAFT_263868 [Trematosphaeria pertusa]
MLTMHAHPHATPHTETAKHRTGRLSSRVASAFIAPLCQLNCAQGGPATSDGPRPIPHLPPTRSRHFSLLRSFTSPTIAK